MSKVLGIGPIGVSLETNSPAVARHLEARYGCYLQNGESQARMRIDAGYAYDPATACTLTWHDETTSWQATSGALDLTFDVPTGTGRVLVTADPDGMPSAIDNAVRGIGARLLAANGLLLAHGCGIVVDGGLHLFYGPSGVGKTTLARLAAAAGLPVAGDDLLVIDPASLKGCGSPFWGDGADLPAAQGWWPLAGCWRLMQAERAAVTPLTGAAAVAELLCQVPLPAHYLPMLLDKVATVTAAVPQARLALPLPSSWNEVREVAFGY